jgi:hypothetical protein
LLALLGAHPITHVSRIMVKARLGIRRGSYKVLVGRPDGKSYLENLDIDGRILRCIFKKWDEEAWTA